MSLSKYNAKRSKQKTPEPFGGKPTGDTLRFVVQKHDASHLHYDFRLEMDGVLKSWAVPKGPSVDPSVKRLAMMVEDHPYDYRSFEGIIPKGEYGGGTVIVWDEGTYEPAENVDGDLKGRQKNLLHQLYSGKLKIKLKGKKLKGEFALVKASGRGENAWLLMKLEDRYAKKEDITLKDKSVLSGKTIAQMEKTSDKVWKNGGEQDIKPVKKSGKKKAALKTEDKPEGTADAANSNEIDINLLLKKAPKTKAPTGIKPMKATLVDEPFNDPDWLYEVKWDGYRAVANIDKNGATLISRNNIPFDKYYPISDALQEWKVNAVIDGEILVINDKGISDFSALQNWRSEADGQLVYYVFDILWYEGKNLMELPLRERIAILTKVLPAGDDRIRQSQAFSTRGIEFFDAAENIGLEGIMAKKADSIYTSDLRSKEWLKIKVQRRQEVVIAGFTKNEGTSKAFSALLLGVYEGKRLRYAGKVGTGFSDKLQKEMMAQFKPYITDKSPFDEEIDVDKPSRFRPQRLGAKPTWLKPVLLCEVNYAEVTKEGIFRQASFKGMRSDKKAKEVVLEKPADTAKVVKEADGQSGVLKKPGSRRRKIQGVRHCLTQPKKHRRGR